MELFKNLVVVELASVLAGPAVGMFFAELGASVLKIENKLTNGDVTRSWKLPSEDQTKDYSAYFCSVNWNKEHLLLDFNDPLALEKVHQKLSKADVVINNLKPRAAKKFELDYDSIKSLNKNIIYADLQGFAQQEERLAYDVVLQAETGFLSMNGESDRDPVKMPVALIDVLAAHQLKEGILVALIQKLQTGKGCLVKVNLEETAISSLVNQATNWLMGNKIPQRMGMLHPNIAPYGELFSTIDGKQIVLAVGSDKQFRQLCVLLKLDSLVSDPDYSNNQSRVINRVQLKSILASVISNWYCDDFLDKCHSLGIPAGQLKTVNEVFESKPGAGMILEERMKDGNLTKRVKSLAFELYFD